MIFINLIFNQSYPDEFVENRRLERWMWVANDYRYVLSYPEDVDVFSFGLLKAKHGSLEVKINIGNLSKICKRQFNFYLAQYLSKVVKSNATATDYSIDTSAGYICHSKIGKDTLGENMYLKLSDISAVKLGFPFWCYEDNNTATIVEKSNINYIVIFIIFFTYCFYPLAIESAFYIEDKKIVQGSYYMSESPYSPSVFCKRILFAGNNKYLATMRIILLITVLTTVIYLIKSEVHDYCNCSLKSSNDDQSFQHAEKIYINNPGYLFSGILQFILINICVLVNSNGILDDFIILDFTNICKKGMFLKTVKVSEFLSNDDEERIQEEEQNEQKKILVSQKIQKLFLVPSYSFWSKLFLINSYTHSRSKDDCRKRACVRIQSIILFPLNFVLVLGSTFCPLVSNVYIFFVNFLNVVIYKGITCCIAKIGDRWKKYEIKGNEEQIPNNNGEMENNGTENENIEISDENTGQNGNEVTHKVNKPNNKKRKNNLKKFLNFILQLISHAFTTSVLVFMYMNSFNIFFCGMSYVIQFFIFTLLLAVPHFPIQYYIYIIFFSSVILYISRFVFQFIKLYRNLLEKILEIQEQTSIPIHHFDRIVAKHFPLSNELFYLLVKIMLTCLFFAIIYDTMENVSYIRFGAQPDLTTIISLIFLFGPPRIVEALLMTDFTSRVHLKEKEIKDELAKIKAEKDNKGPKSIKILSMPQTVLTEEERELPFVKKCIECWRKVKPKDGTESSDDEGNDTSEKKISKSEEKTSTSKEETLRPEYAPACFCCRWIGMFFCGFCNLPLNDEGNCLCCIIFTTSSKSKKTNKSSEKQKKNYDKGRLYWDIPCLCVKDCLNKDTGENPEEKTNLFNKLKTDTLYKITVDTVDEIRPRIIYNAKAEIINDGIIELEKISISDKSDENKQRNENNSNETSIEKSNEIISNCSENEPSTKPKIKGMISQINEHGNGKNNGNAGNVRTADAADEKLQQHETNNSNETSNESVKIVYKRSEIGPFAKPGNKNKVAAIIEHGASKPSLIKEENDNHLNKKSDNQDSKKHKGKDIEDTKYKVDESIELQYFTKL